MNDAPALAWLTSGSPCAGTDVAIETADVVLMRSDPLDVPVALRIGRGTLRKMAEPRLGDRLQRHRTAHRGRRLRAGLRTVLRPEIAALSMSGSSVIVAVNALALKRLRLPAGPPATPPVPTRSWSRSRQASETVTVTSDTSTSSCDAATAARQQRRAQGTTAGLPLARSVSRRRQYSSSSISRERTARRAPVPASAGPPAAHRPAARCAGGSEPGRRCRRESNFRGSCRLP